MPTLPRKQDGAVLIIALMFLLLIALVAATASETNTLQLQMAGNDQLRADAQQRVMAILDAILDNADNTPVIGDIGYKICAAGSTAAGCDQALISLDSAVTDVPNGTSNDYFVTRVGPLETGAPVMSESMASSASAFNVARYEITASFEGEAARLGNSTIVQGITVKIPAQNN
jgi:Tfp pilus assembly protein PilX